MIIQQNNKGQYTVTIPKPLVEAMNWKKGLKLTVEIMDKGRIILSEK